MSKTVTLAPYLRKKLYPGTTCGYAQHVYDTLNYPSTTPSCSFARPSAITQTQPHTQTSPPSLLTPTITIPYRTLTLLHEPLFNTSGTTSAYLARTWLRPRAKNYHVATSGYSNPVSTLTLKQTSRSTAYSSNPHLIPAPKLTHYKNGPPTVNQRLVHDLLHCPRHPH